MLRGKFGRDESWYKYQFDIANGTNNSKKSKTLLPKAVKRLIKQTFMDLSDNDLLEKCLHGKTQNNNGCLNGMLWKKCPKATYVGGDVLEMGVSSAIICFNEGTSGILNVMIKSGIKPGNFS